MCLCSLCRPHSHERYHVRGCSSMGSKNDLWSDQERHVDWRGIARRPIRVPCDGGSTVGVLLSDNKLVLNRRDSSRKIEFFKEVAGE